jgi:hypothetical protein
MYRTVEIQYYASDREWEHGRENDNEKTGDLFNYGESGDSDSEIEIIITVATTVRVTVEGDD